MAHVCWTDTSSHGADTATKAPFSSDGLTTVACKGACPVCSRAGYVLAVHPDPHLTSGPLSRASLSSCSEARWPSGPWREALSRITDTKSERISEQEFRFLGNVQTEAWEK